MNYYRIGVFGISTENVKVGGCHIIKAETAEQALLIQEKHGISNPWGVKSISKFRRTVQFMNLNLSYELLSLQRRWNGIGGCVWFEDKNGNLQKETKDENKTNG